MNPTRKTAVALKYRAQEDRAPRIVAQGHGVLAERILEIAQEHDIPIYEDMLLVEVLARLDIGAEIPESLYQVIAEVLAFVYSLDKRHSDSGKSSVL